MLQYTLFKFFDMRKNKSTIKELYNIITQYNDILEYCDAEISDLLTSHSCEWIDFLVFLGFNEFGEINDLIVSWFWFKRGNIFAYFFNK